MKVLQINCVYGKGSTGKLTEYLHNYYKSVGIESVIIYGRGEKTSEPNVYKVAKERPSKIRNLLSRYSGNVYGSGYLPYKKVVDIIKKEKPDVVHLQCVNGHFINLYKLLNYLKENNINTVLTLHAEFMYTGNCGYAFGCKKFIDEKCRNCPNVRFAINARNKKAPEKNFQKMYDALSGFDNLRIVGVSDWVSERAKMSPITSSKNIKTINNGVDVETFNCTENGVKLFADIKAKGEKIILYVTPYFEDENKGGKYLLELAGSMKELPVHFIVIGNHSENYSLNNITFVGRVESQKELAEYYRSADVTLITSKQETFCMVVAESLSCGTPVVGFKAGGPESIAIPEFSDFVNYGDIEGLKTVILNMFSKKIDKTVVSEKACALYDSSVMAEKYIAIYKEYFSSNGKN